MDPLQEMVVVYIKIVWVLYTMTVGLKLCDNGPKIKLNQYSNIFFQTRDGSLVTRGKKKKTWRVRLGR